MTTQDEASRLSQMNSFNACDKIFLPISFVHFKTEGPLASPNGGLIAVMNDDRQVLNIYSDQKPFIFNEYHLFQCMGLSEATD